VQGGSTMKFFQESNFSTYQVSFIVSISW
jgi:hypothetical protein